MLNLLLIGLGGFIGSIARYGLGQGVMHWSPAMRFPLGTFVVNILGCLVIGLLAGVVDKQSHFSQEAKLFLFTGLLGGFTTFSAFGLETITLMRRDEWAIALLYATGSVVIGLLAVWTGMKAMHLMPR